MHPTSLAMKVILVVMITSLSALLYRASARVPDSSSQPAHGAPHAEVNNAGQPVLPSGAKDIGPTALYGSPSNSKDSDDGLQPQAF